MKKKFLNTIVRAALCLLLVPGFVSCTLGEIGWPTDPSTNRLFTPLIFAADSLKETSAVIKFNQVIGAKRYILEISEDSLQFDNIIRRVVFDADALRKKAGSVSATDITWFAKFSDLNADSYHSARFMAVNADSTLTSKYATVLFKTAAENIIGKVTLAGGGATITWHPTTKLSFLKVTKSATPTVNILQADSMITASELADTTKTFNGLDVGTYYTAKVCYFDGTKVRVRGTATFKTPGTAGSYLCVLKPTDVLTDSLNAFVASGKTNVSFVLENGATYNFGSPVVPAGMVHVTFTAPEGVMPVVNVTKFAPATSMDGFLFENIKMQGTGNYLFSFGSAINFTDFVFSNCYIDSYNSILKFSDALSNCQSITVDKCVVTNFSGGYGPFNIGGSKVTVGKLSITNSTFVAQQTQLMDVRCKLDKVEVVNCTFYNNSTTNKYAQIFRFGSNDLTPTSLIVDKCIFAGNNGGSTIKSINSNYANTASLSFATSYKTSDLPVSTATGVGFTGIKTVSVTGANLFTDPANNIFKIRTDVSFAGRGVAGDPRWW